MNITTEHANGIAVVRVGESRLMYPLLSEFSSAVQKLIASGERRHYLSESLFLNIVSYENERLGAYVKKLTKK